MLKAHLLIGLGVIAFWAVVMWVAAHFIIKFW